LEGLRLTSECVTGRPPSFADVQALSVAWSETTLQFLHHVSCEEPLTGLATSAHVRSRLSELYRHAELAAGPRPRESHALVVVEVARDAAPVLRHRGESTWTRSMRLAALGRTARTVFPGTETIGRLGLHRLVVLAGRDERLGRRVALLRRLADPEGTEGIRVWIEGLPSTDEAAAVLLDELARS